MAYIKSQAILTRIREVIDTGAGIARTIDPMRINGDLPEGLDNMEEARRGVEVARHEAQIVGVSRSSSSPPSLGSLLLYDVAVQIRLIRSVTRHEQISDPDRDVLMAMASEDADVLAQALEFPGNLTATAAATATDLVSGRLRYLSSKVIVKGSVNAGAQAIETVHQFAGIAIARP